MRLPLCPLYFTHALSVVVCGEFITRGQPNRAPMIISAECRAISSLCRHIETLAPETG
jgi:hypothetical protein